MNEQTLKPNYTLRELTAYFWKLGYSGFGGPVALIGYMHRDLVEQRKWITEDEYKEGLTLSQLAPGPLAAQLGIYLGYVHYGVLGATLTGLAFVLPSFFMVVVLGIVYKLYGGISWMQAVFYGVGAAVVGIITMSAYRLTIKSISKATPDAFKQYWLLWLFYVVAAVVTILTHTENIWLFLLAGVVYMMVKAPPKFFNRKYTQAIVLLDIGFWQYDIPTLGKMALFFLKAGAFVFGSGLAIVPFLHSGVVIEQGWLSEHQFLDAVAVAMITPGPVVITVGFIGYLVAGFPGAVVAALATFLPCYILTILPAPYFNRIAKNQSIRAFVDGITAAVVGALMGAVIVIATRSIIDVPTVIMALGAALLLLYRKKIKEPQIVFVAAFIGLVIKLVI